MTGHDFMPEKDILINGEFRNQGKLLIDNRDPLRLAVRNGSKLLNLSVVGNISLIGSVGVNAGENLHQG